MFPSLLVLVPLAAAQEPVTYRDALVAALQHNGILAESIAVAAQAEGSVAAVQGGFDPLYELQAWTSGSRTEGFFQGYPYTSGEQSWQVETRLSGTAATGTTYMLIADLDRNTSRFTNELGQLGSETQLQDAYTSSLTASITQQLLRGVKFRYNVQQIADARADLAVAELDVARQRQETLQTAAQAYWAWAYAVELTGIAKEALAVAEEALRVGRVQVESGQLAPVEGTRLEAAMVQARQDAIDTEHAAEAGANELLLLTGGDPTRPVSPATSPGDAPPIDIDVAKAIEVALAQNLDLAVARAELDAAEIAFSSAKHGLLPVLSATATAGLGSQRCTPTSDAAIAEDCVVGGALDSVTGVFGSDNLPFYTISGLFQVPLGNRSARGERESTAAVVQQRRDALGTLQRTVTADVEDQVRSLESARQRMDLADANVRLAIETLEAEEALFEGGRGLQKDVLEARTQVTRARAEAAKARTDYRLAQTRLLELQGQLTEDAP